MAVGQLEDEAMKEYCKNKTTCRRKMLLKEFDCPTDVILAITPFVLVVMFVSCSALVPSVVYDFLKGYINFDQIMQYTQHNNYI